MGRNSSALFLISEMVLSDNSFFDDFSISYRFRINYKTHIKNNISVVQRYVSQLLTSYTYGHYCTVSRYMIEVLIIIRECHGIVAFLRCCEVIFHAIKFIFLLYVPSPNLLIQKHRLAQSYRPISQKIRRCSNI